MSVVKGEDPAKFKVVAAPPAFGVTVHCRLVKLVAVKPVAV